MVNPVHKYFGDFSNAADNTTQVDNSYFLKGIRIHRHDQPYVSSQPIATLATLLPGTISNATASPKIEVTSVTSERDSTYIQHGWTKETVAIRPAGTRDVAGPSHWEHPTPSKKITYITARHLIPRLKIRIDVEDLRPSEEFVTAINAALAQADQSSKFSELQRVLERWGHVIATHFDVGCSLSATCVELVASFVSHELVYFIFLPDAEYITIGRATFQRRSVARVSFIVPLASQIAKSTATTIRGKSEAGRACRKST